MLMLNLGCGTKTSHRSEVVNIDWSIYLRIKKNVLLRRLAPLVLRGSRLEYFRGLSERIVVHDLRKGIPFDANSVDVVYHSHMLEHLDRDSAKRFAWEVKRVLKPGGVHRVVVPDFGLLCRRYVQNLERYESDPYNAIDHEAFISDILEQSVRREAHGTSQQSSLRRKLENVLLGDARKRGETHQWMYDRITLVQLLISAGYEHIKVHNYRTSYIPTWTSFGLDTDDMGQEYKPNSLYVEARKCG